MEKFIKILRLILILVFLAWGISWISVKAHHKELRDRNMIENFVLDAGNLPHILKQWFIVTFISEEQSLKINKEKGLFEIGKLPKELYIDDSLFILYYQFLGGNKGQIILQNIAHGNIEYFWKVPLNVIMSDLKKINVKLINLYLSDSLPINLSSKVKKNITSIRIKAPLMLSDSSLIFHIGGLGYLYKIDKDSKLLWKSNRLVHHSIELDSSGNIWTCSIDLENKEANYRGYREDAILSISPSGNEKVFYPLSNIFKSNKLFKELIGSRPSYQQPYGLDPYHLNDVLPVKKNGTYWKENDLFLSMRSNSMIVLYRPSIDSIIWHQQGPWLGQHDINIVNDSVISVFNNNIWFFEKNNSKEKSNIAYFDFKNRTTFFKYKNIFHSDVEGRQSQINNNTLLVESTIERKYYILDSIEKVIVKFYLPYYSDSTTTAYPNWARIYVKNKNQYIMQ